MILFTAQNFLGELGKTNFYKKTAAIHEGYVKPIRNTPLLLREGLRLREKQATQYSRSSEA